MVGVGGGVLGSAVAVGEGGGGVFGQRRWEKVLGTQAGGGVVGVLDGGGEVVVGMVGGGGGTVARGGLMA